ncbi:MAG: HAMP domain-containing protein [Lachnospiraceae bacterium]|nr:HAMP domain-containing protein [Lachnospiraceae bacterium]
MRFPIRLEFTLSFLVVMLATIILFLIFDGLFLERFYMRDKEQTLRETYEELNTAATTGDISSDVFDNTLKKNAGRNNIGIVVMDAESVTVKAYSTDSRILIKRLYDNMFGLDQTISSADADRYIEDSQNGASEESGAGESGTSGEAQQSGGGSSDTSGGNASSGTDDGQLDLPVGFVSYTLNVIEQTDHYTLQSVLDANTASRYMELWGTLDSGYFFLLRTPLESIQDASAIATRFFLYLSLFATVIGIVLAMYLGRRITKPIRELTDVSVRMKNLDFSAKYTGQNDTEVGELGKNFNEMSDTLERTISELKSANNQLKQDIKKREEADTMRSEFLSNVTHELKPRSH